MKSLYSFFAALLTILIIASCSDSPAGNDFEQRRIGSFLLTSESTAEWVGSSNKPSAIANSADTVYYGQPDQNHLEVIATPTDDSLFVNVVYTDTARNGSWYDSTDAHQPFVGLFLDGKFNGGAMAATREYTKIDAGIRFSCDSSYTGKAETIRVTILNDSAAKPYGAEDYYEHIYLDTEGIYAATDAMLCQ